MLPGAAYGLWVGQWFSNTSVHEHQPKRLLKGQVLGPIPQSSKSVGLRWSPGVCIFHKPR